MTIKSKIFVVLFVFWASGCGSSGNDGQLEFNMAHDYANGEGVEQSYKKAMTWYLKSAELDHPGAMNNIGNLFRSGHGVKIDYDEAANWYQRSADAGNEHGIFNLADLRKPGQIEFYTGLDWAKGTGVEKNFQKALEWYMKAAAKNNSGAMNNIGGLYRDGNGVRIDYNKAKHWYRRAAAAGDANGKSNLADISKPGQIEFYRGLDLANGTSVKRDYKAAMAWYLKAAKFDHPGALNNIGHFYMHGRGVKLDFSEATAWFQKAAKAGSANGQANLIAIGVPGQYEYIQGRHYDFGDDGTPQDYKTAMKWYLKAAALKHAEAMNNIGVMYRKGQGVKLSYEKATEWYQKGADAGSETAISNLKTIRKPGFYEYSRGTYYDFGTYGYKQDYKQAMIWYLKAAALQHAGAMNNIGVLYKSGQGVTVNLKLAACWYKRGAELGNEHAISNFKVVSNHLPSNYIELTAIERSMDNRDDRLSSMVLVSPAANSTTTESEIRFIATVSDMNGIKNVELLVNGQSIKNWRGIGGIRSDDQDVQNSNISKAINTLIPIDFGLNKFELRATNNNGKVTSKNVTVNRIVQGTGKVLVLTIGISDYEDPEINDLPFAEADAKSVYNFFANSNKSLALKEHCKILLGRKATMSSVRSNIYKHLVQKANPEDTVIYYFAGHGDTGPDGKEYFMIPQDAERDALSATAIERAELQKLWGKIQARRKIFITDACNSGGFTSLRGSGSKGYEAGIGTGTAIFAASSSGQKSMEDPKLKHGLFTWCLLNGLNGSADASHDGRVSLDELSNYLRTEVNKEARKRGSSQQPVSKIDVSGQIYLTKK